MNWVNESVFYHIYPIGFCGAPQSNDWDDAIPRIEKITSWIPHLQSLHVNALYLGPVFESSEHGYDTRDYYTVDRRLGDNAAFKKVCAALHDSGIKIVLDGVFNHVGREFWAFRDVQQHGRNSRYCGWFHNLNFDEASPMGDPFRYDSWQGHFNLVKLNLRNPEVVAHLLGAVGMWMEEFGIDGLRLDAADCVDMDFFRSLKHFCRAKRPDFWLMGEIIHGDYNRWANPELLDSVTNYECAKGLYSSHNDRNYFEIAYSLNRQFGNGGIYRNLCLYNFADNHDLNRLASTLQSKAHLCNVYSLLYTMPGVPSIYYGSEWAVKGIKQNGSDAGIRPCLELGSIESADSHLLEHLKRLGEIRHALPALRYGSYEQILVKNEQLVYKRSTNEQAVYVALNLAENEAQLDFGAAGTALTDALSPSEAFPVQSGGVSVTVPPCAARILVETSGEPLGIEREGAAAPVLCDIKPGRYRHFKGKEYEVIGVAKHSESLEEFVVYRQLYGEGGLWVRPMEMFLETVERDGKTFPRFAYIGR
ncbi:DUF1653 domain-containing protein [Oscillospiraceae bacterium PP1C4]